MVGLGSDGTNANKKVALKWRLFKHYAQILGQQAFCYKWPIGTRWVSHQITALDVHLKNLRVMLAFSNEQAEVPYNTTICKEMTRIEGIGREASDLKLLLYQALRRDIMAYTGPCPLIFGKDNIGYAWSSYCHWKGNKNPFNNINTSFIFNSVSNNHTHERFFFHRHHKIKMPRNIVFWMNLKIKMLQNFLALKYILFYFVNLIGQNSVGQKWQKILSDRNFAFQWRIQKFFRYAVFLVQPHPMPLSPTVARELFFSK